MQLTQNLSYRRITPRLPKIPKPPQFLDLEQKMILTINGRKENELFFRSEYEAARTLMNNGLYHSPGCYKKRRLPVCE